MSVNKSASDWVTRLLAAMPSTETSAPGPGPVSGEIATRGPVATVFLGGRGPLIPAAPRKPRPSGEWNDALSQLFVEPPPVRQEVVGELLRRKDPGAPRVLRALSLEPGDPDPAVRWSIANGLGEAGGEEAVRLLEQIAREDPDETVRTCAIGSLGQLALAAYRTQGVPTEETTPRAIVRTRGPIRTRGSSPVRRSPEAARILDLLNGIRDEETSDSVRHMADMTLIQLGE